MDQNSLKRLALARYLFQLGLEQSEKNEPLSSLSILSFHDSADMFLQLVYELKGLDQQKKKSEPNKLHFLDYLNFIREYLTDNGSGLTRYEEMKRLNEIRINLKHKGIIPSKSDVESLKISVNGFFQENTKTLLDINFEEISLVELIEDQEVKQDLESAIEQTNKNDFQGALGNFAIAFDKLIFNYLKNNQYQHRPLFDFINPLRMSFGTKNKLEPTILRNFEEIEKNLNSLENVIKILCLGIDFRKFSKFKNLVPHTTRAYAGNYQLIYWGRNLDFGEKEETKKDCEFCLSFIIESVIHLQNFNIKD